MILILTLIISTIAIATTNGKVGAVGVKAVVGHHSEVQQIINICII